MPRNKTPTYTITDHLCRFCGYGRILVQTNSGPTGGGNPVYKCSTCGQTACSLTPKSLCYCGFQSPVYDWFQCTTSPVRESSLEIRVYRIVYDITVVARIKRHLEPPVVPLPDLSLEVEDPSMGVHGIRNVEGQGTPDELPRTNTPGNPQPSDRPW